eukprot:27124_1
MLNTIQTESDTYKKISQQIQLYQQLRNQWKIGSKCIVFSKTFKKWIRATITKIENEQNEEILAVTEGDRMGRISFERFSNNIQPIYVSNEESKSNMENKWAHLLNSNDINKSLYVTQNLLKNKENESRLKWNIGHILIIFDYKNEKWVKG